MAKNTMYSTSTLSIVESEFFNSLFAEQPSLPTTNESLLPLQLPLLTENSKPMANCHFSKKNILQIIRNLDSNKAYDLI